MPASLAYHEPSIITILIQASFLLLLNISNFILNHLLYCGLVAEVFLGVAWGTRGAKWLDIEAEQFIRQLGYLGLILVVYEGGLSTSVAALKANFKLSLYVAVTGISLPIGVSFVLLGLTAATPLQSFAAGAALCSTSLGTTFTVLGSSGLISSRLGVVLTSAAMMDDVVGLVMVQIISNLGEASGISAVSVVRPLMVSVAFATMTPVICLFIVKPLTLWLKKKRVDTHRVNTILGKSNTAWVIHTLILVGFVVASTYAGTSNLFASYIAGTCISWWDTEIPHSSTGLSGVEPATTDITSNSTKGSAFSGLYTFERYYKQPLDRILRPFFFASIGFSIPITEMFQGSIIWKGIVYALLMVIGKIACGLWIIRFPKDPNIVSDAIETLYPASILGCAMIARGEIGFVISSIAESNGIYSTSQIKDKSSDNFLVVTWAIVLCTILGPLAVGSLVRRVKQLQQGTDGKDVLGVWGLSQEKP